jgi:hypothetical protein
VKKLLVLLSLVFVVILTSCGSPVKVLVKNISLGGTGDNYVVTPAKVEVTSMKINSVVAVPITITNNDNQQKTFQFKEVSPISGETSADYTPYPVQGIDTFFNQDTINIEGGKKGVVNFYIAKVARIPNTQVWVNISVETDQQITSAYIVNILIKGDK